MTPKYALFALVAVAVLYTAPVNANEYIVTAKPGVRAVNVYDSPNGKLVKAVKPSEIVNLRIQKRSGPWREIDIDFDAVWVAAGDLITRTGAIQTQPGKAIDLTGAASPGLSGSGGTNRRR